MGSMLAVARTGDANHWIPIVLKEVAVADPAFKSARLPVSPSATPAIPASPASRSELPSAPVAFVAGKYIPVVIPFIRADTTGVGALVASAVASTSEQGISTASGQLAAQHTPSQSGVVGFESGGSARAQVAAGLSAKVLVSAGFGSDGRAAAINAIARGTGELSATVVPHSGAVPAFYGTATATGALVLPPVAVSAQLAGSGTLTATAAPGFRPSGMNKSGTQPGPNAQNAWVQVINWTADTANYPGSTVDTDALVSQGARAAATITGSAGWTNGMYTNAIAVRLKKNNTVIATGTSANPATASTTVAVAQGDRITLEVTDTSQWPAFSTATINAANTFLRIT
ncbi:hypothetical protein ABZ540_35625 [Nocardia xishanensis]|uniref:hypothetical protein n=1 Tax=Nocardia xishanensis TaxID=238964 RepID=UPI0033EF14C2